MPPFSQTKILNIPWPSISQNQKTHPEGGKDTVQSVLLFLKTLQEDFIKRLPWAQGSFPLGMLSSFLALTPGRKKKKKHTKNKNTTAKQQLAFILCSELWKYFHTQLEGCKEKLLNGLMPCWQTRPLSRVHRNGGHRWQHRDSQRHSMREWTLRSAVMPAPALITLHTAHSPHGNAGRKAEWSVSGFSKLQPGAKCGPWLVTVNKSVLEHSHTHSFTVYGCFPATTTALSRSWNRGVVPTMLKLLFGPLQNVFVNPNLRDTYEEGSRPLSYWLAGPRRKHVSTLL